MNSKHIAKPATKEDAHGIAQLLLHYSEMGNLLPRNKADIEQHIENFFVIHEDSQVIACGALEHFTKELVEIRSLVVHPDQHSKGLGRILVERLIQLAEERQAKRVMALTYSVGFFKKLGFIVVDKAIFPEKVWGICVNCYKFNNCDETAVLLTL
ncbi:MAG: N-acetyltransferase [Arenicella sp.]